MPSEQVLLRPGDAVPRCGLPQAPRAHRWMPPAAAAAVRRDGRQGHREHPAADPGRRAGGSAGPHHRVGPAGQGSWVPVDGSPCTAGGDCGLPGPDPTARARYATAYLRGTRRRTYSRGTRNRTFLGTRRRTPIRPAEVRHGSTPSSGRCPASRHTRSRRSQRMRQRGDSVTRQQLDLIPDDLIRPAKRGGCGDLLAWLAARGWSMSLLELGEERRRRGLPSRWS